MASEFKVGDNAVYPGHGVGTVIAISTKEISGNKLDFYTIQILESGMKIMIPKNNVESVGLRPIISKEEALIEIYKKLRPGDPVTFEGAQNYLNNLFFYPLYPKP